MKYPAIFTPGSEGRVIVKFRDIPEALTQGDDEAEAMDLAQDALITAMECYFDDRRAVPLPSPIQEGERYITVPLTITAKVLLLNDMIEERIRPADLARLMGVKPQEVTRLLDLRYKTRIETVADAMHSIGRELYVVRE
jgi:antitoxin HicB